MATPERSSTPPAQPAGVEGDGLDSYPTYHDARTPPHRATTTKPTDVGLPRSRRSYSLPIFIALVVFGLVILVRVVWGSLNMAGSADEAMSSGDAATPPAASAPAQPAGTTGQAPEAAGTLDRDVQPQTTTGPAEVEATPGAVDVPGGAATPAPAQ